MRRVLDHGSSILAQTNDAGTSTVVLYTVPTGRRAIISQIIVANSTAGAAAASVFAHATGTTRTAATALMYGKSIAPNTSDLSLLFDDGLEIAAGGSIGTQSGTGSALTFTLLGRLLDVL